MSPISTGVRIPPRSRTFTEQDAREAHAALVAAQEAGTVNEGVGYGDFPTAEAARAAGGSLNKIINALGLTDQKWAGTVFKVTVPKDPADPEGEQIEKYRGVLLPKAAKPAPPAPAAKTNGGRKRR